MTCPAVQTGNRFISQALAHVDCQAQAIGAYGFGTLSDPNAFPGALLTGLLTLFVAILGLRLMMGESLSRRDIAGSLLKIGIALTLATSWPAWRTLGYDTVLKGPEELATAISGGADLPGSQGDLATRLQTIDDSIVLLTMYGTGRGIGGEVRSQGLGDSFRGIALGDQDGFGKGRIAFLAGTMAPLSLVRLSAGFLLALAPLVAGLLLFAGTRDLFFGWLRALAATALGSTALVVLSGVQISILEPWLREALTMRSAQILAPSVPTELVAITYSFAIASFGILILISKMMFFSRFSASSSGRSAAAGVIEPSRSWLPVTAAAASPSAQPELPTRAFQVASAVASSMRRETQAAGGADFRDKNAAIRDEMAAHQASFAPLGRSYRSGARRSHRRSSSASLRSVDCH